MSLSKAELEVRNAEIARLAVDEGMTQARIAARYGLHVTTVGKLLTGMGIRKLIHERQTAEPPPPAEPEQCRLLRALLLSRTPVPVSVGGALLGYPVRFGGRELAA